MKDGVILKVSFLTSSILYLTLLAYYLPKFTIFGNYLPVEVSLTNILLKNSFTYLCHLLLPFLLPLYLWVDVSQLEGLKKFVLPDFNFKIIVLCYVVEHAIYSLGFAYGVLLYRKRSLRIVKSKTLLVGYAILVLFAFIEKITLMR